MVPLVVNGVTYQYPVNDDISWGISATNWAIAVTDTLAIAVQAGDIGSSTQVTILESVTDQAVTNLLFNNGVTRSGNIDYYVVRTKGSTEVDEVGSLRIIYKTQSSTWSIERQHSGEDCNISFDINTSGQVTYTTTPIAGSGVYSGVMRYRARTVIS